ncbi:ribonuclease P protein component [Aestuariibacter salexigens]|uniref:ribonuclease P protein component n=1 Tax=Aestuariibacter salexigens TaxID=226010 RepID=UPI000478D2BE|nr:ribonuclease P protein component [Aestuariibacter salexigens]
MGENNFSRELRLLTPTHFQHVFSDAIPAVSPHLTLLARKNELTYPRLGITVSKKNVKHAVERNRIKRIIRESFRHHQHNLPTIDIIAIGKRGIAQLDNQQLFSVLEKQWIKLIKRCDT